MIQDICKRSISCLTIFFATLTIFPASAQQVWKASDIPDSLRQMASKVTRLRDLRMRVENLSELKYDLHEVTTFFEYTSTDPIQIMGQEDTFNKVKSMSLLLFDAQGKVLFESKKSDIKKTSISPPEYSHSDDVVKFISISAPAPPFTVEIRLSVEIQNTLGFPDFEIQSPGEAVENARVILESPPGFLYKWKAVNSALTPTSTRSADGYDVKIWAVQQRKAIPEESFSNPNEHSAIVFTPEQFLWFDRTMSMADWKLFGKCIFDLNAGRTALSPEFKSQIRNLVSGCKNDREKIDVLYSFLQKYSRYVSIQIGIGGWQTQEAGFVEKNRFGDCKALSNFMKAMLEVVDIEARLVLIRGDDDGCPQLENDIIQNVFNHMIAYVPSENIWLECTSPIDPPGWLSTFTSGREALVLGPDGGELLRTPDYTLKENKSAVSSWIEVQEDGNAHIQMVSMHGGTRQDAFRRLVFKDKGEMLQKQFIGMLDFSVAKITRLEIQPDPLIPLTRIELECTTGGIATHTGKRLFVSFNKLNPLGKAFKKQENRSRPVVIPGGFAVADTMQLKFPPGFVPEALPKDTRIESPYGSYESTAIYADGVITCTRKAEFRPVVAPAKEYEALRQFYAAVAKADNQQIVLVAL